MNRIRFAMFFGALALASASAEAQTNIRVRGAIAAFEGNVLSVKSGDGKNADNQTMTNATVSAMVQAASGRELTLTYEGSSQKIVVPENASISMLVPGERSHLAPGASVNLTAAPGADGRMTALRIQVSPVK